jgi:hypothetical protein
MTGQRWRSLRLRRLCAAVLFELPHPVWALWIPFFPRLLHDGLSFFCPVRVGLDEKPAGRVLDDLKLYWPRRHSKTNEAGAAYVPCLLIPTISRDGSKGGRSRGVISRLEHLPLAATAWPDWDKGSADTDSLEARADRASIESILHPAVSAIANGLSCRNDRHRLCSCLRTGERSLKFTVEIYAPAKDGSEILLHRADVSSITPLGARKKAKLVLSQWQRHGAKTARVLNGNADTVFTIDG